MGNPKQKWTSEEEEALRAGVAKHGAGKWKNIQRDPEFNHLLYARSNIDLKDKWRNLGVANGQGPREKSKTPKPKTNPAETPDAPQPVSPSSAPASFTPSSQDQDTLVDEVMVESTRPMPLPEGNSAAKYNAIIYEALSTLQQPNGLDSSAIANFIEQRQEVPQKFRRTLTSRLRRLVQQDKLEKVQNCYKIKGDAVLSTKKPGLLSKDLLPRPLHSIGIFGDTVEEASISAALKIAEAENKEFVAAESVKEAERVATMAEDMQSFLQFVTDCFEQSVYGEIMLMV